MGIEKIVTINDVTKEIEIVFIVEDMMFVKELSFCIPWINQYIKTDTGNKNPRTGGINTIGNRIHLQMPRSAFFILKPEELEKCLALFLVLDSRKSIKKQKKITKVEISKTP